MSGLAFIRISLNKFIEQEWFLSQYKELQTGTAVQHTEYQPVWSFW